MTEPQTSGPAVVVGCDGSWQSERAVAAGTMEAARRGCALVLLCVVDETAAEWASLSQVRDAEETAVRSALSLAGRAEAIAHRINPGVPTEVMTPIGVDDPALRELSQRADLLVLGGHGARGQVAFSLGSVSEDLVHVLACPLLVPRLSPAPLGSTQTSRPPSVVLGLPEDARAPELASMAVAEASRRGCGLVVVVAAPPRGGDGAETQLRHLWERAWSVIHRVPGVADVPVRVVVEHDDPASALTTEANAGDLIVVGTRSTGRLAGLVRESVARRVLDTLPCDVLVVPPTRTTVGRPVRPRRVRVEA